MMTKNDTDVPVRTLKVSVPMDYHLRLHAIKIVEGQTVSETVRLALHAYFDELDADVPNAMMKPMTGGGSE